MGNYLLFLHVYFDYMKICYKIEWVIKMILKNDCLKIKINSFGAELKSIIKNDVEYLWQADPLFWKRSSPILFPIVGRLIDNEYIFNNQIYKMTQHGFARDKEFKLINHDHQSALYLLNEDEDTLKIYPFKFNLYVGYELNKNELKVLWKVENTNNHDMFFQIGAHPAFNFLNGSILEVNKTTNQYELQGKPQISHIKKDVTVKDILVNDQTFINDAIIYENIDQITLKDISKSITLKFKGFPYLGIWSQVAHGKNAPFICLEPWHGITDFKDHDKQFIHKVGMNILKINEVFETSYTILIS